MSLAWVQHLMLAPVLLPLLCGALLILVNERHHQRKFVINLISTVSLLVVSLVLLQLSDGEFWTDGIGVYLSANWAAPFGVVLLIDRLSAVMLLLTSALALASLVFSMTRWSRIGVHFHSLFQFLLMGINGAFLTNDLFNLFVFFEVMLAASYGLVLHGYNGVRIRAGMQYIVINLIASFFFLIGVALIYATAGTLNMTDLAVRVSTLEADELVLLKVGVTILALAFLTKSAMWPLGFWLPTTYAAASPPVAAMMVLMTKIGVYVVLRLWLLVFSEGAAAGFGFGALLWGGLATLAFGTIGLLASQEPGRMAGYAAVVSSGTLLAAVGYGQPSLIGAALFYLISSTLAVSAFLLLIELIERIRTPSAAMLALTMEAFAVEDSPEEPVGVAIPGALAFLGLSLAGCALVITGLPPLSGFIAKFGLLHALLNPGPGGGSGMVTWVLLVLVVLSGLAGIISLMRFGVRTFWAAKNVTPPRLQLAEVMPVSLLLLLCVMLTVKAGPAMDYLERSAASLHQPETYVQRVLFEPVVLREAIEGERP
ncbi:monovalent cation/H+ antiporter subunit D [Billgrantia endophytica]|uniref:Monovalent cation/H+ antiporter subunit D n=1 Tax=Billgrantia endophytica TaxID=2033802 RepID=A0A2N7U1V4_9GAMM|nr:monovalent cation/H+ antiporter subunit D [Halomonas endophytica]PMR74409.1 monovalent cation/H+ antiporter subunit D [Halomonas endophytica]